MGRRRINLKWGIAYLIIYSVVTALIIPFLFNNIVVNLIPTSLPNATTTSILDDAIVVNGIILGFVLVVLDDNTKELRTLSSTDTDYPTRFTVLMIDVVMVIISINELFGEMFGLAGVSTALAPVLYRSLFVPIRFGLYMLFRFLALVLG